MIQRALLGISALALSACAVTPLPELPPNHPASPNAAPAPVRPRVAFTADESTRTTDQLLTSGPTSGGTNTDSKPMSDMPGMPGMNH